MISIKMSNKVPRRSAGTVISMLMLLASTGAVSAATDGDTRWLSSLQQQGWSPKDLVNKIQHGHVTTYELGTPNYQILNPEDEPVYITEDQPQYRELLRRLTSTANASDTIDVDMPAVSSSVSAKAVAEAQITDQLEKLRKRSFDEEAEKSTEKIIEKTTEKIIVKTTEKTTEKSVENSVNKEAETSTENAINKEVDKAINKTVDWNVDELTNKIDSEEKTETVPADVKGQHLKVIVFADAKPFQKEIANLS